MLPFQGANGGTDYLPKALPFHDTNGGTDYLPKALPFQGVALG